MFSNQEVFADSLQTDTTLVHQPTKAKSNSVYSLNFFIKQNALFQKKIKDAFTHLSTDYNSSGSIKVLLLIFLFAFLYGFLHSLGPGHGKVFIFSYILTEKPRISRAIAISFLIAIVHALSGLLVSLLIIFSIGGISQLGFETSNAQLISSQISYSIIILLGLYILFRTLFHKHEHSHEQNPNRQFKLIPFITSIGFVPCPGTILLVTFLASMGLLAVGIWSVLFIILGMGFTMSLVGLVSIFSKQIIIKLTQTNEKINQRIFNISSIIGGILLILFGILFLVSNF